MKNKEKRKVNIEKTNKSQCSKKKNHKRTKLSRKKEMQND